MQIVGKTFKLFNDGVGFWQKHCVGKYTFSCAN